MTPPRTARLLSPLAGLAVLAMLGACAGSTTLAPRPKEQTTMMRPPTKPADLDQSGLDGARAAADYVLALYGYTYQSSDPDPLEAFCAVDNHACRALGLEVGAYDELGLTTTGGDLTWADEPSIVRADGWPAYVVDGTVTKSAVAAHGTDGALAMTSPAVEMPVRIVITNETGEWLCAELTLVTE